MIAESPPSNRIDQTGRDPLLIATATFQEMRAVLAPFNDRPELMVNRPLSRRYQGKRFVLLVTGIGPVNAAGSIGRVFGAGIRIRGVVNLGIGGTFDPIQLPLLDKAVVQEELWPEIGVRTETGIEIQALRRGLGEGQDELIHNRLVLDPEEKAGCLGLEVPEQWPRVRSLTVAGVTGTADEASHRATVYEAQCENMEGFALASVCLQERIPFLEARSISNRVGSRDSEDWDLRGSLQVLKEMSGQLLV